MNKRQKCKKLNLIAIFSISIPIIPSAILYFLHSIWAIDMYRLLAFMWLIGVGCIIGVTIIQQEMKEESIKKE